MLPNYLSIKVPMPAVGLALDMIQMWVAQLFFMPTRVSSKQSNIFFGSNRNSICFGCFSVCFAKPKNIFFGLLRFVLVFWTSSETTEKNRIFSKQTETNQKIPQKTLSIRGYSKPLIFFLGSNRNKPKLNLFRLFFGLLFRETPKIFFRFVSVCFNVSDRYRLFRNTETPCFDIEAKQPKQTSCFG
jgi:hypothetical protein